MDTFLIRNCDKKLKRIKIVKFRKLLGFNEDNLKIVEEKNCLNCNNKFDTLHNRNQKYCSLECRQDYLRKKYKDNYTPKKLFIGKEMNCKNCNYQFTQNTSNQVFCSDQCNKLFYKELNRKIGLGIIESPNKYASLLKLRFEVLKRDNFQCKYCGRSPKTDNCKLHIDHVIPRSKGGNNNSENLITSCAECNLGKLDTLLETRNLEVKNE
jgi:predicted nucleic acid-binding Zn ribbon protein